jgi:RNA polymerase sigma-B factor
MTALTATPARCAPSATPSIDAAKARARGDAALMARRAAGDPGAREALIERFLPLARSIARRYESSGEPLEDLVQVASLALVKAVDRYDPSRGNAFSSFAVPTIAGELKRHFRDRTWTVRPPRDLQELTIKVERVTTELWQRNDRAPTVADLAAELGLDEEHILEALHARTARGRLSLDAPTGGDDGERPALGDVLGSVDGGYDQAESRTLLDRLLATVSARDREVIRLRFEEDLTQAEIGERLGVSQMQVSRIVRQTLAQLRHVADQQQRIIDQRV